MAGRTNPKLYRASALGESLTETLDQLISEENFPEALAWKVLEQNDAVRFSPSLLGRSTYVVQSITENLAKSIKSKVTGTVSLFPLSKDLLTLHSKGQLHTYRYCDGVWTFIVEGASFRTDSENIMTDKIKIVAIDGTR